MEPTALFDIRGKTALVTGGAQGMGRMIAEGLVRAGATVYITSRKAEVCERAASEMGAFGQCFALPGELTAPEDVAALAKRLGEHVRALHILINNAGRTWGAPLESFPDKAWAGVMAVNVQTPFTLVRDLLPLLKAAASASDPARVINIGSLAGLAVEKLSAYSYAASKAAIHHLTRVLAADLAPFHIAVNTVAPGATLTERTAGDAEYEKVWSTITPLGRPATALDIAQAALFLVSSHARHITGQTRVVDGGWTAVSPGPY